MDETLSNSLNFLVTKQEGRVHQPPVSPVIMIFIHDNTKTKRRYVNIFFHKSTGR